MTSPDASSATRVNFSLNENEALAADNPVPRQRRGSTLVVVAVSAIRNRSVPLCPKLNIMPSRCDPKRRPQIATVGGSSITFVSSAVARRPMLKGKTQLGMSKIHQLLSNHGQESTASNLPGARRAPSSTCASVAQRPPPN